MDMDPAIPLAIVCARTGTVVSSVTGVQPIITCTPFADIALPISPVMVTEVAMSQMDFAIAIRVSQDHLARNAIQIIMTTLTVDSVLEMQPVQIMESAISKGFVTVTLVLEVQLAINAMCSTIPQTTPSAYATASKCCCNIQLV